MMNKLLYLIINLSFICSIQAMKRKKTVKLIFIKGRQYALIRSQDHVKIEHRTDKYFWTHTIQLLKLVPKDRIIPRSKRQKVDSNGKYRVRS